MDIVYIKTCQNILSTDQW